MPNVFSPPTGEGLGKDHKLTSVCEKRRGHLIKGSPYAIFSYFNSKTAVSLGGIAIFFRSLIFLSDSIFTADDANWDLSL